MPNKLFTIDHLCDAIERAGNQFTRDGSKVEVFGGLYLRGLTALPDGVTLSAGGYLYLRGLTALPEGVTLSAGGGLDLGGLTALPEGVTLSAGGYLYLGGLSQEDQRYQGKSIRLRMIDGYCMRLINSKKIGEITAWTAQYFNGDLENARRCFVAQSGGFYAHGNTIEVALRDLRFKVAQVNSDLADLISTIRDRGTVTFNDYRLITGACESGLREGLRIRGISPDTEFLPLKDALALCDGGYGGDVFRRALGA